MKRLTAVILCVVMLMSFFPADIVSAGSDTDALISVETVTGIPGATVELTVNIENNPGIASAGLTFTLEDGLSLVGATNGKAFSTMTMTPPAKLVNGGTVTGSCNFAWLGSNNNEENGVILTLKVKVSEDAQVNKKFAVTVSAKSGDILNSQRKAVSTDFSSGTINVLDYMPGDVDNNGTINMLDVLTLCQYYVDGSKYDPDGYAVSIREAAGDVDGNGTINMLDVLTLCQYYVDGCKYDPEGYGVKLLPGQQACAHNLTAVEEKAVSCTVDGNIAYWYCEQCGNYYRDADADDIITEEETIIKAPGHTVVIDEAVAPTYDATGLTEGSHCSVCKEVLAEQTVIPKLTKETGSITYIYDENDAYLCEHLEDVTNPNPESYTVEDGLTLSNNVKFAGYTFTGWYDGPSDGATKITKIESGTKENMELFAHFDKVQYTVTLSDTICGDTKLTYTVDEGTSLGKNPEWSGYVFTGWSDKTGAVVQSISAGTTGNIKLTANWTSERNKTVPVSELDNPMILHDDDNGQILFTYEIGEIRNVPLYTIKEFLNVVAGCIPCSLHHSLTVFPQDRHSSISCAHFRKDA